MPAEWEPQEAVWLSWPHKKASWPGLFRTIPATFAGYVAAISRYEMVRINCGAPLQERAKRLCTKAGAVMERVEFYDHPTNDAWCRDHGPIFVKHRKSGEVALTDWMHNAWGGKYPPFDLDNEIPPSVALALGMPRFEKSMVLEGGSIDVNGRGLLLTTEQCLLHPNRNPDLTRKEIEQALKDYLGVRRILWLGKGIVGDDTDGHIDDIARFFKPDGLITCVEKNRRSPNHKLFAANRERMLDFRTMQGKPIEVVELPIPKPVIIKGVQVPASYANFLIVNGAVLVPTFQQPRRDAEACSIIGSWFPGRDVVPIDCSALIWGLGTLHCLSQQQPA
ncbi:MAG: agmatine deiminase family protein [Candidatus Synoicihabitans palmerolidicus]|nr:agmatine deiminase family protein [Candidatus Synoicihabitans palmerolidicus]